MRWSACCLLAGRVGMKTRGRHFTEAMCRGSDADERIGPEGVSSRRLTELETGYMLEVGGGGRRQLRHLAREGCVSAGVRFGTREGRRRFAARRFVNKNCLRGGWEGYWGR